LSFSVIQEFETVIQKSKKKVTDIQKCTFLFLFCFFYAGCKLLPAGLLQGNMLNILIRPAFFSRPTNWVIGPSPYCHPYLFISLERQYLFRCENQMFPMCSYRSCNNLVTLWPWFKVNIFVTPFTRSTCCKSFHFLSYGILTNWLNMTFSKILTLYSYIVYALQYPFSLNSKLALSLWSNYSTLVDL